MKPRCRRLTGKKVMYAMSAEELEVHEQEVQLVRLVNIGDIVCGMIPIVGVLAWITFQLWLTR